MITTLRTVNELFGVEKDPMKANHSMGGNHDLQINFYLIVEPGCGDDVP